MKKIFILLFVLFLTGSNVFATEINNKAIENYQYGMELIKNGQEFFQADFAKEFFLESAKQGYAPAMYRLGYLNQFFYGDDAEAAKWYEDAGKHGSSQALISLGLMYASGEGVVKNYKKTIALYLAAIEKNNPDAQYQLGIMYLEGKGVKKSIQETLKLFSQAATNKEVDLEWFSGNKNIKKAIDLYSRSSMENDKDTLYYLGLIYENGFGVKKNYNKAVSLYKKASNLGNKEASQRIISLREQSNNPHIHNKMM